MVMKTPTEKKTHPLLDKLKQYKKGSDKKIQELIEKNKFNMLKIETRQS